MAGKVAYMPNVSAGGEDPAQPHDHGGGRLLAGRYRLLTPVGHGGMGTVWHAHDEVLGRDVAVKEVILPLGLSGDEREVHHKRTFREARTAARLAHPGVVTVFDVVQEDGRPWIIMELIRAPSLDQVIKEQGRLPPRRAAQIARQMLGALHTAHEAGVLHRDVKPSNVLVAPGDRAVLTDFGIATAAGDVTLTQTGLVMGSPAYIAPERARGRTAGPASDLWSLGITMYAMVEGGSSPYERSEPMASLIAVISEDPEPPAHAGSLRPIIDGLLRKDPETRLSALEAGALLDQVVRGLAITRRNTLPLAPVREPNRPTTVLKTPGTEIPRPAPPADAPVDEPADAPADGTPVDGTPADETPTDETPTAGPPADEADEAPPGKTQAGKTPAAETPAGDAGAPADAPVPSAAPPPGGSPAASPAPPGPRPDVEPTVDSAVATAGAAGEAQDGDVTAGRPAAAATAAGLVDAGPTGPMPRPAWGKTTLVILAIALAALLTLGIWALVSRNAEKTDSGAARRSRSPATASSGRGAAPQSPTAPATRTGTAGQTAGRSSSPAVATGFRRHTDPTGFSVDVPADWTGPERRTGGVFFYAPDRQTYVQIDQTDHPHPSALADWQSQERDAPARFAGYRRVRLGPTGDQPPVPDTGDGSKSADWEFTWGSGAAKKHILDRGFVTGGHAYAILISAPDSGWAATIDHLRTVFASFRPAQ
jgi:serine/threonine protein kinase